MAAICDGTVECLGSEDEQYCDITELIVGILLCLAVAPCVAVLVVWFCRDGDKNNTQSSKISKEKITEYEKNIMEFLEIVLETNPEKGGKSEESITKFSGKIISIGDIMLKETLNQ